jgi:hypothetical protein
MLKSIGNKISSVTQSDKYGQSIHFISFYCSILARLAYMNDTTFLTNYCKIFNNQNTIVPLSVLEIINKNAGTSNIFKTTDLEIANETNPDTSSNDLMAKINITQYAKKINVINGEVGPELGHLVDSNGNPIDVSISTDDSKRIKYISIGTSNYGEIYVLTDTAMPNIVLVLFRGTYSAKTTNSWLKPSSAIPTISEGDKYLKGIYKITMEMMNTITESIRYLTKNINQDNIRIITTGHSLGAAMSTIFTYKWVQMSTRPAKVSDKITCVSLGSPRIFGEDTSVKFCEFASGINQKIFYLRIVTRGDTVASLPPKGLNFSHPCSKNGEHFRKQVYESCNTAYTSTLSMNYDGNLDCQNFERRAYITNPLSHTNYLLIKYLMAVDVSAFLKSGVSIKTSEVVRNSSNNNATVCRLIYFNGLANVGEEFKVIFFDMNKARGTNIDDKGEEDKLNSENKIVKMEETKEEQSGGFFGFKKTPATPATPATQQPTTNATPQQPTTNTATQQPTTQPAKQSTFDKMRTMDVFKDKNVNEAVFEKMMSEMKPIQTIPTIAKLPLKFSNIFIDFPNVQVQSGGKKTIHRRKYKNKKTKRKMFKRRKTNKRRRN